MAQNRWWAPGLIFLALTLGACGSIPTDLLDADTEFSGRVYVDDDWGFRISIPDATEWGFTAQTAVRDRLSNGLPRMELVITQAPIDGGFRPTLVLQPKALDRSDTVEHFANAAEQVHMGRFLGYQAGPKRTYTVGEAEVVDWVFTTVRIPAVGDRFLLAVVKDGTKGYVLLGSGLGSQFPLDRYREMLSSMKFR